VSDFCVCADLSDQRNRTLEALSPKAGGALLDIGCGLGHLCRDAELMMGQESCVIGLDKNRDNLAFAASVDTGSCRYIQADALALPLKPHSIDYAACIQVAEYIPDTRALVSGVQRVLRRGGKAVFVTTDWRSLSWSAADSALIEAIKALWCKHCVHPDLHASLAHHMEAAGLDVQRSWVHTIRNSRYDQTQYSYGLVQIIRSFARLTRPSHSRSAVVDSWHSQIQELQEQGKYEFRLDRVFHLVGQP
jgi:ubiquinone/menaquinone biosynthesis C-methylase UbiE